MLAASVNYDPIAESYAQFELPEPVRDRLRAAIAEVCLEALPNDEILADLGCGPGGHALEFAGRGIHVIAMDISSAMLDLAASVPCERLSLLRGDVCMAPLKSKSVDAIFLSQVLHFVSDPPAVVRECRRLLRDHGSLIVNGPNDRSTSEVSSTANVLYRRKLQQLGVILVKMPGWTSKQIQEKLDAEFHHKRIIEDPRLEFSFEERADHQMVRLEHQYTAFQIGVPPEKHRAACQSARQELDITFGHERVAQPVLCHWTERVTMYQGAK